jgi:hypothetical protein
MTHDPHCGNCAFLCDSEDDDGVYSMYLCGQTLRRMNGWGPSSSGCWAADRVFLLGDDCLHHYVKAVKAAVAVGLMDKCAADASLGDKGGQ